MASAKGHRLPLEDLVSAGRRRTRQGWVLPPQSGLATRGREYPMMRERLQTQAAILRNGRWRLLRIDHLQSQENNVPSRHIGR